MVKKYDYKKLDENTEEYIKNFKKNELVKILKILSEYYYNTDKNLVSDITYDKIRNQLEKIDPTNKYLNTVGAPIIGLKNKVRLPYQMGSLSKIKEKSEVLEKWTKKYKGQYVISDKMDGVSAQIYKDINGEMHLYTRGDGIEGQDISHLLQFINCDEKIIPNGTSIRGELIINKKNFKKIENTMANARNAVAGLVNSKTVDNEIAKNTDFIAYSILYPKMYHSEQMIQLEKYNFKVVNYKIYDKIDIEILVNLLIERKEKSKYDIDGLVCFDDYDIYDNNGENFKTCPDFGFAFKMITETVDTTIKKVIWNISRRGYIIPKIEIEPINIGGTEIKHATAFNAKYIVNNIIGKGAKITIIRSGDVIPYILKVLSPAISGKPDLPKIEYKFNKSGVNMIVIDFDNNEIKIKKISYFFENIGVKGLGEGIAKKLVENGYNTIIKVLKAEQNKLSNIDGLGEKSINKIFAEIDNAMKKVPLNKFMNACQKFKLLGSRKIGDILKSYPNILINDWTKEQFITKIIEIKGFSNITAEYFVKGFNNFKKIYIAIGKIYDLSRFEKIIKENKINSEKNEEFDGKIIVFTGFRDEELKNIIEKFGAKVTTSVSSKTSLVVYADKEENSTKINKANEFGIKTINKIDFEKNVKKYKI
jgi:NAD-dependent DNA ligase